MFKITDSSLEFANSTLVKLDDKIALLHGALNLIGKDITKKDATAIAKKIKILQQNLESIIKDLEF